MTRVKRRTPRNEGNPGSWSRAGFYKVRWTVRWKPEKYLSISTLEPAAALLFFIFAFLFRPLSSVSKISKRIQRQYFKLKYPRICFERKRYTKHLHRPTDDVFSCTKRTQQNHTYQAEKTYENHNTCNTLLASYFTVTTDVDELTCLQSVLSRA